jgi:hypothetical protein
MAILFIIDAVAGGLAFDTGNKKAEGCGNGAG